MTILDRITVDFGERTFEGWASYRLDSDLLTPADGWVVELPLRGTAEERRALRQYVRVDSRLRARAWLQRSDSGDRSLQLTGIIDDISVEGSREGAIMRISGRDNGGLLASASASSNLGVTETTTLADAVGAIVAPYGVEVTLDGAASRLIASGRTTSEERGRIRREIGESRGVPASEVTDSMLTRLREEARAGRTSTVSAERRRAEMAESALAEEQARLRSINAAERRARRASAGHGNGMRSSEIARLALSDAKPSPGETVWEFVDRHARRFGVMPWIAADGRLVLSSPHYDQRPSYSLVRYLGASQASQNTILGGGLTESLADQASDVTVFGRTGARDVTRSAHRGFVERNADLFPIFRPLTISDPSARTDEQALRRAQREIARQNERAFVLEYEMRGHGQGDAIFAIDTVADVVDEEVGIEGLYYVTARTLACDRGRGRTTRLRLVPLGAISP